VKDDGRDEKYRECPGEDEQQDNESFSSTSAGSDGIGERGTPVHEVGLGFVARVVYI